MKLFWIWVSGSGGDVVKRISYLELWHPPPPLLVKAKSFMQFWKRASCGTFMWSYMKFGPVIQEKMSFKDISYVELWQSLCSVDWNHLCNIGRRHHEEQYCEIILKFDPWFRRKCRLKVFLIWSSGSPFVQWGVTVCANLVEGIKRNNSVNLFWIWTSGSGENAV